ncbi:alkaline phosphatase family protein [Palaeococcus ferrophilus]|uniref:alkaline phosphatase family protein n=1 Tax=Palaeococcus ferrophilus TaxID=83868 RepID=UPI00064FFC9C|nr:alkaline phosphatase family protein [Palaeococcus ferrophilus]
MRENDVKVFVLGLDGGSWNVIMPLITEGKLPTFKRLLEKGAYGKLKSIIPPISVPAWKCYFTGKDPGKLGVYAFLKFDPGTYKLKVADSRDFKSLDLADILGMHNKRIVIYKMFSTYPAKKVNGVMITDFPNLPKGTYPEGLYEIIKKKFGEIFHNIAFTTDRVRTYEIVLEETKRDFEVIKWLITENNPDFVHMSVPHTDGVQHFFWRDMLDPESPYHDYIERMWVMVDGLVGDLLKFLESTGDKWYFFIMSDHGFTECKYRFNIANWLIKKGYLKLTFRGKVIRSVSRIISLDTAYKIVEKTIKFGNEKLRIKRLKWGVQHKLAGDVLYQVIGFKNTKVIPIEGQLLYLNRRLFKNEEERKRFVTQLVSELKNIIRPDGEPFTLEIYEGHQLYNENAPDIILLPNQTYVYSLPFIHSDWDIPPEGKWTGMHDLYGIFVAVGGGIKENYEVDGARLVDLMPTILQVYGIPIPKDVSGKVLRDIFEDREFREEEPEYVDYNLKMQVRKIAKKLKL